MQEEVTQKTIALSVNVGKGAARLTEQALQKAIKKFLEQKSKAPHGKQTMRQPFGAYGPAAGRRTRRPALPD